MAESLELPPEKLRASCDPAQLLMLREDVVWAVHQGEFHVYAVSQADQGIKLLTGLPVAQIHTRVQQRLMEYATRMRDYSGRG